MNPNDRQERNSLHHIIGVLEDYARGLKDLVRALQGNESRRDVVALMQELVDHDIGRILGVGLPPNWQDEDQQLSQRIKSLLEDIRKDAELAVAFVGREGIPPALDFLVSGIRMNVEGQLHSPSQSDVSGTGTCAPETSQPAVYSGRCDVCGREFAGTAFLLTTKQVVASVRYWDWTFGAAGLRFDAGYRSPEQNVSIVHQKADVIFQAIASPTPWMICDACIDMFDVDREESRGYAGRWYETNRGFDPPGCGPASLDDARIPFADPVEQFLISTDLRMGNRQLISKKSSRMTALARMDRGVTVAEASARDVARRLARLDRRCFIATAVYARNSPELEVLRRYRERVLMPNWLGRRFVTLYYRLSPSVAAWLSRSSMRKQAARLLLAPIVALVRKTIVARDS